MDFGGNKPMPAEEKVDIDMMRPKPAPAPVVPASFSPPVGASELESKVLACAKAEDIMKHAFSAMRFNDVDAASLKLREALALLAPYTRSKVI